MSAGDDYSPTTVQDGYILTVDSTERGINVGGEERHDLPKLIGGMCIVNELKDFGYYTKVAVDFG